MGLFDSAEEQARKAKLKQLEDKRVAFARALSAQGFAPERMLFAQTDNGGFTALSRFNGEYWLIVAPGFGTDEDFAVERHDRLDYRVEEVRVASEGMGGIFGFGKKAEIGADYVIARRDGGEAHMPFVCGRSCWLDCTSLKKNPLLRTERRRGDANVVWDFRPIDKTAVNAVLDAARKYFE